MTRRKDPSQLLRRKHSKVLPGHRFGRLTVIAECEKPDSYQSLSHSYVKFYFCQCECGEAAVATASKLNSGQKRSCGCLQSEVTTERSYKHGGNIRGQRTKAYNTWAHIQQRCYNPNNCSYADYGGRGISVCDRWRESFENFLADMGEPPSAQHSIDRIDHNGNYEPANCRWAAKIVQMNNKRSNRRITVHGRTQTLAEWARETSLTSNMIYGRIKMGWSEERAITTPRLRN